MEPTMPLTLQNPEAEAPAQTDVNALFGTETAQPTPEVKPQVEDAPINASFPEDVTAPVTPPENKRAAFERNARDEHVITAEEFTRRVLEARKPEVKPVAVQPLAPAMRAQTEAEMAEGARMSKVHADRKITNPPMPKSAKELAAEGKLGTHAVFRPPAKVPDQFKAEGYADGQPKGRTYA
jgi:hypothetical protein